MTFTKQASKRKLAKILEHFKDKTFVALDVEAVIHTHRNMCYAYVNYLHQVTHEIHITEWVRRGEKKLFMVPVYKVGKGADKPKPPNRSATEKSRLYRKRLKERREQELYVDRRSLANHKKPKADIGAAWLNWKAKPMKKLIVDENGTEMDIVENENGKFELLGAFYSPSMAEECAKFIEAFGLEFFQGPAENAEAARQSVANALRAKFVPGFERNETAVCCGKPLSCIEPCLLRR
jgi:hypothetical protein